MKIQNEAGVKIQHYLQAHQPEMVTFLTALVKAESPSTEPASQAAAQTILWEALTE